MVGQVESVALPVRARGKGMRRLLSFGQGLLRVAGAGFLFAVFGIGSVVLAHGVLKVVYRGCPRPERELRAQARLQRWFIAYIELGRQLGIFGLTTSGMESLGDGPTLIVANHPTLLDVVFLLSLLPQGDCVVKKEAWENRALGGIVSAVGYIPNRGGSEFVEACSARLSAGRSVLIFPEGTRSSEEGLRQFNRGAAHIALRTGCRVFPVLISCDPPALKKGQPWYAMPNSRLRYSLRGGKPFTAADVVGSGVATSMAARKITEYLRDQFELGLEDETA